MCSDPTDHCAIPHNSTGSPDSMPFFLPVIRVLVPWRGMVHLRAIVPVPDTVLDWNQSSRCNCFMTESSLGNKFLGINHGSLYNWNAETKFLLYVSFWHIYVKGRPGNSQISIATSCLAWPPDEKSSYIVQEADNLHHGILRCQGPFLSGLFRTQHPFLMALGTLSVSSYFIRRGRFRASKDWKTKPCSDQ